MNSKLRNYRLVIYEPIVGSSSVIFETYASPAVEIEFPITINFNFVSGENLGFPSFSARIYNLSPSTRQKIFRDPYEDRATNFVRCEFFAGYNDNLRLLFNGSIISAFSYREGKEVVTEINCQSVIPFNPFVSVTLAEGVTNKEAIEYVITNYAPSNNVGTISVPSIINARGLTLTGSAGLVIKKLAQGKEFYDGMTINVLQDDEVFEASVPVLDDSTGLLGTPRLYDRLLQCDLMFQPNIILGQIVELNSSVEPIWTGVYKVVAIKHSGYISGSFCGSLITTLQLRAGDFPKVFRSTTLRRLI